MSRTKTNKTTLTQKGQVTIPKEIREYLKLKAKNQVEFRIEKGKVVIKPIISLESNFGKIKPKRKPEDFKKIRKSFKKGVAKEVMREP
jgi:AbrB family looped-hinge helix DNA binding protein